MVRDGRIAGLQRTPAKSWPGSGCPPGATAIEPPNRSGFGLRQSSSGAAAPPCPDRHTLRRPGAGRRGAVWAGTRAVPAATSAATPRGHPLAVPQTGSGHAGSGSNAGGAGRARSRPSMPNPDAYRREKPQASRLRRAHDARRSVESTGATKKARPKPSPEMRSTRQSAGAEAPASWIRSRAGRGSGTRTRRPTSWSAARRCRH